MGGKRDRTDLPADQYEPCGNLEDGSDHSGTLELILRCDGFSLRWEPHRRSRVRFSDSCEFGDRRSFGCRYRSPCAPRPLERKICLPATRAGDLASRSRCRTGCSNLIAAVRTRSDVHTGSHVASMVAGVIHQVWLTAPLHLRIPGTPSQARASYCRYNLQYISGPLVRQ